MIFWRKIYEKLLFFCNGREVYLWNLVFVSKTDVLFMFILFSVNHSISLIFPSIHARSSYAYNFAISTIFSNSFLFNFITESLGCLTKEISLNSIVCFIFNKGTGFFSVSIGSKVTLTH